MQLQRSRTGVPFSRSKFSILKRQPTMGTRPFDLKSIIPPVIPRYPFISISPFFCLSCFPLPSLYSPRLEVQVNRTQEFEKRVYYCLSTGVYVQKTKYQPHTNGWQASCGLWQRLIGSLSLLQHTGLFCRTLLQKRPMCNMTHSYTTVTCLIHTLLPRFEP